jgi:DUF1365 family protein
MLRTVTTGTARPDPHPLASALWFGEVEHQRHLPVPHGFRYRLFLVGLDLDELPHALDGRWFWSARRMAPAWFRRADYLGPADVPLKQAVLDEVERLGGNRPDGRVQVLTSLRYWGYCFNPVTFYYCHDRSGQLVSVLAEITNTPWQERHRYLVQAAPDAAPGAPLRRGFAKEFHVSPFLPMDMDYAWQFSVPGDTLSVDMVNRRDGAVWFGARLSLRRQPLSGYNLAKALVVHPWITLKVVLAIHWNALLLWWKRVPFHTHPAKRTASSP